MMWDTTSFTATNVLEYNMTKKDKPYHIFYTLHAKKIEAQTPYNTQYTHADTHQPSKDVYF